MKRVRKILNQTNPGAMIDLHSANQFNEKDGFANSANLYLEHFPYLDRLWFGEYFDYDMPPEFWIVEVSGIPYGLMGEMLWEGGNKWRGMIYGMTNRMPWSNDADPRPLWNLWDSFGMRSSRMIGYWVKSVPVKTSDSLVKATVYMKPGKALVAIASWAAGNEAINLQVDWKALGINPALAKVTAPAIAGMQQQHAVDITKAISVEKGKGIILVIEGK